jgi:hypothetical protein
MFFAETAPHLGDYDIVLFASPEQRCLYGLNSTGSLGTPKRVWLVTFGDYSKLQPVDIDCVDQAAIQQYWRNYESIRRWADTRSVEVKAVPRYLNALRSFDDEFGPDNALLRPLAVDISCAPRGHLLALLEFLHRRHIRRNQRLVLMYSLASHQSTSEEDFSYGIQDIAVVPALGGTIRLRQDLLILILGFEGNRAYSLYRRLAPNRTMLILGDSGDEEREFYLEQAQRNNHGLIHIHGNTVHTMPSREPIAFARRLKALLDEEVEPIKTRFNVYLSCLGTKAQTVGCFLALLGYPYIQVLDTLPTRRRMASEGHRCTLFGDLGDFALLADNPALHAQREQQDAFSQEVQSDMNP